MSASLVGSEMCIRDSLMPLMTSASHCSSLAPFLRMDLALSTPMPAPMAVSYTHLTLPTICSV
eukprot:13619259-Alexandrium_andersonii.AAC.1